MEHPAQDGIPSKSAVSFETLSGPQVPTKSSAIDRGSASKPDLRRPTNTRPEIHDGHEHGKESQGTAGTRRSEMQGLKLANDSNKGTTSLETEQQIGIGSETIGSSSSSSSSSSSESSSLSDLVDFEPLHQCNSIFTVKQTEGLDLSEAVIWEVYFKIFNHRGQHIFSAAEVKAQWHKCPTWDFCFYVFSSCGRPLCTIAQRGYAQCSSWPSDQRDSWMVYRVADDWLNERNKSFLFEYDSDHRAQHIHVALTRSGTFLGHIWDGGDTFVAYDIEYNPIFSLVHKNSVAAESLHMGEPLLPEDPQPSADTPAATAATATAVAGAAANGDILYEIYAEASRVGDVQINVQTKGVFDGGLTPASRDCLCARFPTEFEPEDKILILAFLLFQQRKNAFCKRICGLFANCYILTPLISLVTLTCSFILLWKLDYFSLD